MSPRFSVVIPTYNRADLLVRCLDSLVQQEFQDFEVLVCDDGSQDDSGAVCERYRGLLDLRYLWNENWGGPARPRNIGMAHARGEWICFLDSDDWWHPDKLSACLPFTNQFDIISHKMIRSSENGFNGIIEGRQLNSVNPTQDLLVFLNNIPLSSQVIRKSLLSRLNGFSERKDLIGVEDYDLLVRSSQQNARFKHIPMILGYYWEPESGDNISATSRQIRNELSIFFSHRKLLTKRLQIDSWCHLHLRHARRHYRNRRFDLAKRSLCIAIGTRHLKFWAFAAILYIFNSRIFPITPSRIFNVRI